MKKVIVWAIGLLSLPMVAQEAFIGLKSGYYGGVHQVTSNPANISTNHLKWNVNLLSFNTNLAVSEANFNLKKADKITEAAKKGLIKGNFSLGAYNEILGPSFMFSIGENHALAFTTRTRAFLSGDNLDMNFVGRMTDLFSKDDKINLPSQVQLNNQKINLNVLAEVGATWAGTIWRFDSHILKGGITAKYVIGGANFHLNINKLNAFLREDLVKDETYLENTNADVMVASSGVNLEKFDADDLLKSSARGFGFDLGLIYEYRNLSDGPYIFKAGIALTDIGSLTYTPQKNESFQYKLSNATLRFSHFVEDLNKQSQEKKAVGAYKVSLPMALQMNFDYHIGKRFFVDFSGKFGLSKSNPKNPYYGNSLVVTPRFERKELSVYLPLSYNDFNYLNKTNIGFGLRVGPLTFGTSDIIAPFKKQVNDVNLFVGIVFGQSR